MRHAIIAMVAALALLAAAPAGADLMAYDPATGTIMGFAPKGAQAQAQAWEARGWVVVDAVRVNRKSHLVVDGLVVAKPEPTPQQALALAKQRALAKLNAAGEEYALGRYGTATLNLGREYREDFRGVLKDPEASAKQKAAARQGLLRLAALRTWLTDTLPDALEAKGAEIMAAASLEDLKAIAWGLAALDASDPGLSMMGEIRPLRRTALTPAAAPEPVEE